jgi:LuxR family transcriptional regulator, maltose regulon positive regulatory protein
VAFAERAASGVPTERRHAFDVKLTAVRLGLARRRGDFDSVRGQVESLRGLLEAQAGGEAVLAGEARAIALMNLGIVELWSLMNDESKLHLEEGLELARKLGTPYIEIGCLSHLAVVTATLGAFRMAQEHAQKAIAVAEAHGWTAEGIVAIAPLLLATLATLQGRFEDARRRLDHAELALRGGAEPAAELLLQLVRGWLCLAEGRDEDAVDAFCAGEQQQKLLVAPQRLGAPMRFFVVQTLLRLGDTAAARAKLAEIPEENRDWPDSRTAFAAVHIAEGDAVAAINMVAPVIDSPSRASKSATMHAFLLDALARDMLGDAHGAESSLEHALEFSEPDGIVFPFVAIPARKLLERHRRRTAHHTLLSDILDVLDGSALASPAGQRPPLREDLSESELRVLRYLPSNLSAPEIGNELYVSLSTVKTHMRHIYAKLGVHSRTEAVDRARGLGLLSPSVRR